MDREQLASEADRIATDLSLHSEGPPEETPVTAALGWKIEALVVLAEDFVELHTGADSTWTNRVAEVIARAASANRLSSLSRAIMAAGEIAALLRVWAEEVRQGRISPLTVESAGVREVAANDLMEQVRMLNEDRSVTPAAPIVLAGAALEIALRSAVQERNVTVVGNPGINSYSTALKSDGLLSKQDVKDLAQMAGLRNQAAHGQHDALSRDRAGLMEQQVNMFLHRLEELLR